MTIQTSLGRRGFLVSGAAVAGGFSLGFHLPFDESVAHAQTVKELNAWVVIHPDDKVVIRIARSEMGQGTLTGLCQLVAEELECDWNKVTWEYPTPGENLKRNRVWKNFSTGGSRGIRESQQYVREGGAIAREMLIAAAAKQWNVPAAECSAANSVITHKASGKTLTYGAVAAAAAELEPPKDVKLKDPKDWKIAGKPLKRLDTVDKVTGKQIYGIDYTMPGMLNATVRACPVIGGKLKSFDAAKVEKMPGVKKIVAIDGNAVVVVADTYWQAKTALDALPTNWDIGELGKVSSETITAMLKEGLDAEEAFVGNKAGDAQKAIDGAAKKVEAVYSFPYQHHVTMEPMNATALYTADKCEVWCGTQNGEAALAAASEAAGLPVAKCEVYKLHAGRRLRPARPLRLCAPGRARRQGDAGHAGQADLVARRGHDALPVPSDDDGQADGRSRRPGQPGRPAHAHLRPVDPGLAAAAEPAERHGSRRLPGPHAGRRRGGLRLRHPEPADRPRHAQPARPGGLLARRERQPERRLHGMLHGRAGRRRRARIRWPSA